TILRVPFYPRVCLLLLASSSAVSALPADRDAQISDGLQGFVETLAVDQAAGDAAYVGTTQGIYQSVDHGQTWQSIGSNLGQSKVTFIGIDPSDSATLYIGVETIGVLKSLDGGATFAASNAGLPNYCVVTRIVIAPSDPSTLYLAGCGLYRSTNAGENW